MAPISCSEAAKLVSSHHIPTLSCNSERGGEVSTMQKQHPTDDPRPQKPTILIGGGREGEVSSLRRTPAETPPAETRGETAGKSSAATHRAPTSYNQLEEAKETFAPQNSAQQPHFHPGNNKPHTRLHQLLRQKPIPELANSAPNCRRRHLGQEGRKLVMRTKLVIMRTKK